MTLLKRKEIFLIKEKYISEFKSRKIDLESAWYKLDRMQDRSWRNQSHWRECSEKMGQITKEQDVLDKMVKFLELLD